MTKQYKRTTVTAALPYANGPLHIGHIAGAYLPADIYVRCLRARGKEVLFVCGSDEHAAGHRGQVPRADGEGLRGLRYPLRHLRPHEQRVAQADQSGFLSPAEQE